MPKHRHRRLLAHPSAPAALPGRICVAALLTLVVAGCVQTAPPDATGGASTAPGQCLKPGDISDRDRDFSRHPDLTGPDRCVTETSFEENGARWTIQTVRNTKKRGPLWVLPHDDEQAAVTTVAYALERYGGTAVLVDTGGRRINRGVDPNRNFDTGRSRCRSRPSPRFVAAMLGERGWGAPVIALHTNAPGVAGRGGYGSISILAPGPGDRAYRGQSPTGGLASPDSLVIMATTRSPDADPGIQRLVDRLTDQGVNVMVEHASSRHSDCSLSNYAALAGISPYLNLEVRDGDSATQRRMVDIAMKILSR